MRKVGNSSSWTRWETRGRGTNKKIGWVCVVGKKGGFVLRLGSDYHITNYLIQDRRV